MTKRIIAIIVIYAAATAAWMILGGVTALRTGRQEASLMKRIETVWGSSHVQSPPYVFYETRSGKYQTKVHEIPLGGTEASVGLALEYRRKGLLWYDTYKVDFLGKYRIRNPLPEPKDIKVRFRFPTASAIYDDFRLAVDGRPIDLREFSKESGSFSIPMRGGEEGTLEIGYRSQGLDKWTYDLGHSGEENRYARDAGVTRVKNFILTMTTNFRDIDFPENTISPTEKKETGAGWTLTWRYKDLISGFRIGMDMPERINPGPLASQMSFFAPVSLLFFFFVVFMAGAILEVRIHPMNYIFLAASFFSFHLLFAYTVDHIDIVTAFLASSAVSMALVVSYMRVVAGARFAVAVVGLSQFVFLVLFSLAHFFRGYTGLAITIGAIVTLGLMMRLTAKIDWEEKFRPPAKP